MHTSSLLRLHGRWARLAVALLASTLVFGVLSVEPARAAVVSVTASPLTGPTPTISGTVVVGATLTVNKGTWRPTGIRFSYQWNADGVKVTGATNTTFVVPSSTVGKRITVTVVAKKNHYTTTSHTSVASAVVPHLVFASKPTPALSGGASVGTTVRAVTGNWSPAATSYSYQWRANGEPIGGATGATYAITSGEMGKTISVDVTGHRSRYTAVTVTSGTSSPVPTPPVTGTAAARTQRMSESTLNSTQVGWWEAGSVLTLVCFQRGQSVKGYFSDYVGNGGWDNLWYRVNDGYYVADVDLETGTLDPIVAACPEQPAASTTNALVKATTQRMSAATLNSTQNGSYAVDSRLTLTCYAHGQAVQGYFSPYIGNGGYDDLWYKVNDGYWVADVDIETGSNDPVAPACTPSPSSPPASNDLLTRAKSWLDAAVPYNQGLYFDNQYGHYRQDCSGFVSMALGLSSSYTTVTLPQVLHRINKEDLQPGDIMLNTAPGNNGHTGIFVRWANAAHTQYVSWEENGAAGRAFEQTIPYPYIAAWPGSSAYYPYRRN